MTLIALGSKLTTYILFVTEDLSLNPRAFCILLVFDVAVVGIPLPLTTGNRLDFVWKIAPLALFCSSSTTSTSRTDRIDTRIFYYVDITEVNVCHDGLLQDDGFPDTCVPPLTTTDDA